MGLRSIITILFIKATTRLETFLTNVSKTEKKNNHLLYIYIGKDCSEWWPWQDISRVLRSFIGIINKINNEITRFAVFFHMLQNFEKNKWLMENKLAHYALRTKVDTWTQKQKHSEFKVFCDLNFKVIWNPWLWRQSFGVELPRSGEKILRYETES